MQTAGTDLHSAPDASPRASRQDHLWFLESMDRVHRAIQGTHDLEQMMRDVLDVALSTFDCDHALLVYPCDPDTTAFQVPMRRTRVGVPCVFEPGVEYAAAEDVLAVFRAARTKDGPVRLETGAEHRVPAQVERDFDVQSALVMAVYPKIGKPYQFTLHQCSRPRQWTQQEQRLFEEIGRRLADALTTMLMLRDLRQSEARLDEAERITHAAYTERDLDTGDVTTSPEGFRILGLTSGDGPISLAEILERVHPDDRHIITRRVAESVESKDGGVHDLEYRLVRPNGEVRIVHSRGAVVEDGHSGTRRAVSIVQDITEHKRAEYLASQVFDKSPDGIAIVGADYKYRRANSVYERTLHIPVGTVTGMHMADVLGAELFGNVAKPYLDRCFAGEEVKFARWVDVPFGRMYASVSYTPLPLHSERIAAALIIVSDLTEHMLAQESLQKAQTELAHMARVTTLAEIGSSIAHEINQPLAAIVMSGNACRRWLAGDPPNLDEAREAVARIINDGNRASQIVGRIRSLLQGGAPVTEPLKVDELIDETVALVRTELTRRAVAIRLDLRAKPGDIIGDRVQLQQVLVNLILNSADAMSTIAEGARLLTVRSSAQEDGGVTVEVEDTGTGFAADEADKIFDAFYSTKENGLGMGLSISRSIIDAHGGHLWATSNDGPGATLHFRLPSGA